MAKRLTSRVQCPNCGSSETARIEYGLIKVEPGGQFDRDLETGRVVLGGCMISGDDPDRYCRSCGHSWRARRAKPRLSESVVADPEDHR